MPSHQGAEALSASGRSSEKLSLPTLQSKMKSDPDGYESELILLYSQFKSSLELFQQQAALNFTSISGIGSDPSVAKDLGDRALILAHVTPFYPNHLADFPKQLAGLLSSASRSLPSGLRCHVAQSLILLSNRQMIDIEETLALFMDLQTLGDKPLRKLAFSHVIHSIKRMNQKHKNDAKNRKLQNIVFAMLQQDDEAKAKRALTTLCELHRRKLWFDDRTANAIATACFHSSPRIMIAALSFLLDYEKIEDDDDSDASSGEDDPNPQAPHVVINKQAIYNAHHKGTVSSKKKKQAKLQRAMRSMKRQQRLSSENVSSNNYSPLNHLKDAQGFVEKLFSRLQTCNERFEVRMMMLKVIARTVGLHRLILLNFYHFIEKYIQVPPDAVEPLFRKIVNQFVHDRSRPEAIAVGLNVIREICLRMPLLMTEDLLQDLALYKKSHEKAVSIAARSLITLFREVCPALLIKKDRGRPTDPKARPKAYGEVNVSSNVPGVELLQEDDNNEEDISDAEGSSSNDSGDDHDNEVDVASNDEENQLYGDITGSEDDELEDDEVAQNEDGNNIIDSDDSDVSDNDDDDDGKEEEEEEEMEAADEDVNEATKCSSKTRDINARDSETGGRESKAKKRKLSDFDGQLLAADSSLRALKRLAGVTMGQTSPDSTDGILSNEDFQRIKELKAKKDANDALVKHGLRKGIPSSDQLSTKRVDPAKLEFHVKKKMSKEERLALVRAGREDRGKYQARTSVKQKKTGGLSNRQKERKKNLPMAAKKAKVARSQLEKKKKQQRAGKQFRGRKAWK
ncbi:protein SDA1 homolog isoform X2 [Quercus lobata]|uniref:protein SDA1 homolog isoform X2 n=1 Tax=Quercus lobata TaxID=97700 RepID=UPI0012469920|nr:protein SDA1 homolog isoform X2 [Quercus lobata]